MASETGPQAQSRICLIPFWMDKVNWRSMCIPTSILASSCTWEYICWTDEGLKQFIYIPPIHKTSHTVYDVHQDINCMQLSPCPLWFSAEVNTHGQGVSMVHTTWNWHFRIEMLPGHSLPQVLSSMMQSCGMCHCIWWATQKIWTALKTWLFFVVVLHLINSMAMMEVVLLPLAHACW